MDFTTMRNRLIEHFNEMVNGVDHLFEVSVDKDEMWNLYLDSFPAGTNEIYRERREHDCSCCRLFIKSIGNVVTIKNNQVETIWDFRTDDTTYQPVLDALSAYIKSHIVSDIYMSQFKKIGTRCSYEELENGFLHEWTHFYLDLPIRFVNRSSRSIGDIKGEFRETKNVFKRSLDEISMDALDVVLELIVSNTLYKGTEWKDVLTKFREYKKAYDALASTVEKELYAWENSVKAGSVIGRIKNHSIGTLLLNLSNGISLDDAVRHYEVIVAPSNYKRSKPIFTKKMLEDAQKKVIDLGYMDSLPRRFATLDDITVNDILFSNRDAAKRINGATDIFGELAKSAKGGSAKKFSKVEEVTIDTFIKKILPTASEVEVYFENKHSKNLVSLIAPQNKDSKSMFKWGNNFGWAYSGNLTDSEMKERVKSAGGSVTGDLRFSIQWNEDGTDNCDLDAHCRTPCTEIFFSRKHDVRTDGCLDVDIICPNGKIAVENITWANRRTMCDGTYRFFVRQYSGSVKNGFRAEIEFDGQIYSFDYPHSMRANENVRVADVILKNGRFTIKEFISSGVSSKEIWGVNTNKFVPVSVICFSPNYWSSVEKSVGHKHVFFMLQGCINDENPSGLFNEFLVQDLYAHRKVMEALGSKLRVESIDDQLSGLGFSTTKRDELMVKVKGNTERVLKIKF